MLSPAVFEGTKGDFDQIEPTCILIFSLTCLYFTYMHHTQHQHPTLDFESEFMFKENSVSLACIHESSYIRMQVLILNLS